MIRKQRQIRLQNLELLVAEAGSAAKLARLVGTNSAYISQIRHQLPTPKGTPRRMGDQLAEKLERGMAKPEGWMDEPHRYTPDPPVAGKDMNTQYWPIVHSLHPLISWVQAGEWSEIMAGRVPPYDSELLPCPVRCSEHTFVLGVHGISMEPKFHAGDLIFVDPEATPVHGKYVVVQLDESNEATFKQLVVEGGRQYLKALNPDWPNRIIEVNAAATICGVVVFKGEVV